MNQEQIQQLVNQSVQTAIAPLAEENQKLRNQIDDMNIRERQKDSVLLLQPLKIKVDKEKVIEFLQPENIRPDTEWYWIDENKNTTRAFSLFADHSVQTHLGGERLKEEAKLEFGHPYHEVGTDLGPYNILMADLTNIPYVNVLPTDITSKKVRLPHNVKPRTNGHYKLSEAMEIMEYTMSQPHGPRNLHFKKNGEVFPKIMRAEAFRLWVAGKYMERWKIQKIRALSKQTIGNQDPNALKTGKGLEALMQEAAAVGT